MTIFLFFFGANPMEWVLIAAVIFMLFGASRLPQLAKSIGQSKKAFQDGLREAELDEAEKGKQITPPVSAISDEELMAEMRRRVDTKHINS